MREHDIDKTDGPCIGKDTQFKSDLGHSGSVVSGTTFITVND